MASIFDASRSVQQLQAELRELTKRVTALEATNATLSRRAPKLRLKGNCRTASTLMPLYYVEGNFASAIRGTTLDIDFAKPFKDVDTMSVWSTIEVVGISTDWQVRASSVTTTQIKLTFTASSTGAVVNFSAITGVDINVLVFGDLSEGVL